MEAYIAKLQSAAEKLSTENRRLRKWHMDFIDKVVACRLCFSQLFSHMTEYKEEPHFVRIFLWEHNLGLVNNISVHFSGGDTDECGPAETSAAVEGRTSGPAHRLCHSGGSGINYSQKSVCVYPCTSYNLFYIQFILYSIL